MAGRRPRLALTVGDMAGVGPELVLATWRRLSATADLVAYAEPAWLEHARASLGAAWGDVLPGAIRVIEAPDAATGDPNVVDVRAVGPHPTEALGDYPWGRAVPGFGAIQHAALCAAIDDALAGAVDAIVTAPWHKKRLADAGLQATGHTEVLARRCGVDDVVMVLAGDTLRVALATTHVALRDVPDVLTPGRLAFTVRTFACALRRGWGIEAPRVAVCGLNPHAGEDGVMGDEEQRWIGATLDALRADGFDIEGPLPADTLFAAVARGRRRADGIVAMYHDQGLAPLKLWHFGEAANITVGLPITRTSVDHGTAYDIAGTGAVDVSSFVYAAESALRLSSRRKSGVT